MSISFSISAAAKSLLLLTTIAMNLCITAAGAEAMSGWENIALRRPYTMQPAPNGRLCTDAGDAKQLTDGERTQATPALWVQQGAVGWIRVSNVIINVDLGKIQPIRGVSCHTAAGSEGVGWLRSIAVLVSDDGKTFHMAGDLLDLSKKSGMPPATGYADYYFSTDQLKTHGRYVAFVVFPHRMSASFSCDEIEVYKGDDSWLARQHSEETISDIAEFVSVSYTRMGIQERLRNDLRDVKDVLLNNNTQGEVKARIGAQLNTLESELISTPRLPEHFHAVFPFSPLHEKIFQGQARVWQALGFPPYTVWSENIWNPLLPTALPPRNTEAVLNVPMMQNEYRAAGFNIASAVDSPAVFTMQIIGLPGGTNPPYISVSQALWTDTKSGVPVCSALPQLRQETSAFSVLIPSGLPQQVWLTFHPTDIPPGNYTGRILLKREKQEISIPITLHIYPLRFPDVPSLHVGGWDYTDSAESFDITPGNRDAVVTHLREHFIDSPWAHREVLAVGKFDQNGDWISKPDTTRFDQWVARWHGARQYCVAVAATEKFEGCRMGTPEFDTRVGIWIRFWADYAVKSGLNPRQLVLLLVDEPGTPHQEEIIIAWANAIHAAKTGIKIWEDTSQYDPNLSSEMMNACDVLCPNRQDFLANNPTIKRDYFAKRQSQGTELGFYSASGPSTLLDPYAYYRLQGWFCWQYKAQSSYFWSFGDAGGGASWNEFSAKSKTHVPYFLDEKSVTPAKQMEALREGIEDYEYLAMLRDRVNDAERAGVEGALLDQAKRLLDQAALKVCNAPGADAFMWADEKDRSIADTVRIEVLETLEKLQNAQNEKRNPDVKQGAKRKVFDGSPLVGH